MTLRIPPGRAGRLWLRERLAAAHKAADLLDHKRRELDMELSRVRRIAEERQKAWTEAAREAAEWMLRVDDDAGTARSVRLAASLLDRPAEVELRWRQVMGVRYAADYEVHFPSAAPLGFLTGGAALAPALSAYRHAADTAVAHAVARTAVARIQRDIDRTKRRLRALKLRAIPDHERALAALELTLDEKSREDAVGARWAAEGPPAHSRHDLS